MIKKYSYCLLAALFLSNCAQLKSLSETQKPNISVDDLRVTDLSLQGIEITFDLQVTNPNPIALNLTSYNYDLLVEENSFIKGNKSLETIIEANQSSIISIPVNFTYKELYNTFTSLNSKTEGGYKFLANIGIDAPFLGPMEIPIEKEGSFPIVKAPTFSVSKFSIKNISFAKADLELEMNVTNPNTFRVMMNEIDYSINFNGFNTIEGTNNNSLVIDENETGSLIIPASFNFLELGSAAYSAIISGDPFTYSLTGSANVGATLPIFKSTSFNFDKSGVVDILR